MKLFHSYKHYSYDTGVQRQSSISKYIGLAMIAILGLVVGLSILTNISKHPEIKIIDKLVFDKKKMDTISMTSKNASDKSVGATMNELAKTVPDPNHIVTSTIFWVGEKANSDNGYIANNQSAWDEQWQQSYGGVDTPTVRSGLYPAGFTPKENPFYIALPYNDLDENGNRKPTAEYCKQLNTSINERYSWCKNVWIKIISPNGIAYAQWEDVGPYQEDDTAYVFGNSQPKNAHDSKAGLDVSPAVASYLKLRDVDKVYWEFVNSASVTPGPWKNIVTVSHGNSIY